MTSDKTPRSFLRRLARNWAVPVGCGLLFLVLLKAVLFVGYVPSSSMEPAIRKGSIILGLRVYGEPQLGDVVVFEKNGTMTVKRIAGVPGDLMIADGQESIRVPEGRYYMLGDNLEGSIDSRSWENPFVPAGSIKAVLLFLEPRNRINSEDVP